MIAVFAMVSYLRAGLLLHFVTLLEISLLAAFVPKLLSTKTGLHLETSLNAGILFFLTLLPIMSQLDARSRYQEFKRVKDQFRIFGFDGRLLKPLVNSRCQRDAARAAAYELGYGRQCREFYHSLGYRWYHLTPNFLLSNPRFLTSRRFWKSTFFLSTYPRAKNRRSGRPFPGVRTTGSAARPPAGRRQRPPSRSGSWRRTGPAPW